MSARSAPVRPLAAVLFLLTALVLPACSTGAPEDTPGPPSGTHGMVSTAHPLATEVGLQVLREGGNAFDAAVAVAAALGVVEPMMSGMGGYGTILVHSAAEDRSVFLNPSGRIPEGVDADLYREPTPSYMENRRGAKAVSTPGNVNAWAAMWERFGGREWRELLEPAARLAEEGFVLDERMAGMIEGAYDEFPEHARAFYGTADAGAGGMRPLRAGERLVQEDLARSLRQVATEGPGVVHGGEVGVAIDRAMREAEGFLRLSDLERNEAEWWDPIEIQYRGHRVVTASPPANSFPALVRLGLMSRFDPAALGHNTADYLHLYAEATKHAFWTRLRWAGDPDVAPPPLDDLLSEGYWADTAASFDHERARDFEPPGVNVSQGDHTTHFVVADAEGNVVSATQTLGNLFGARIMPEETGIWLNNSLAYSTFEPPGNPMDAHPGRRKLSGDVPLFVMSDGRVRIAAGTPGGHTIAQTMPQIVMNVVDFGMDIEEAISQPRIAFVEPNHLAVEEGIPADVRAELERRGHQLRLRSAIGNAHGLAIEWGIDGRPRRFTGGADPRGAGLARGY